MRRVLLVVHYPVFGGPHNEALRRNDALAERGWETTVVIPDEPGTALDRLRTGGVDVVAMPLHRLRATPDPRRHLAASRQFRADVAALRRLIRERSIDLVEVGGLVNPHAAVAARREGVPVVWKILDTRPPATLRRAVMPLVRRLADAVLFDGAALVPLHAGGRSLPAPAFVYYPPVDTSRFRPSDEHRRAVRAELGIPAEAPVVGTVANLNPQKGIEYFVRASALVHAIRPDAHFAVVGAEYETHRTYNDSIRREIRSAGIPPANFLLTGERADVERFYPAMDVKLITSLPRSEGTTTTAIEAMACAIPVVATDVGAVAEVVADGETGVLVAPCDPAALADGTLRLLGDPELRAGMGERGRERANARYTVEAYADTHVRAFEAAVAGGRLRSARRLAARPSGLASADAAGVRDLLVCPACRGGLSWNEARVACAACARDYTVVEGIPMLLADDSAEATTKSEQAAYFDRIDADYETKRPHGTPAFHRWLLGEKFERSVAALAPIAPGSTALTVCGGSGMDAEYLARAGARVIATDISLEAARRARERARRYGLAIEPVVADAERLPFRDRSIDLVYVHDGLHHLETPFAGLAEMARVARRAVSVNEPARAAATALAVRLGLAAIQEEAGNRIARLRLGEVAEALEQRGLRVVTASRYAMYYRHEPGGVSRFLSHQPLLRFAAAGMTAVNRVGGRIGNKLTVQAVRD